MLSVFGRPIHQRVSSQKKKKKITEKFKAHLQISITLLNPITTDHVE